LNISIFSIFTAVFVLNLQKTFSTINGNVQQDDSRTTIGRQ
jgi:hypothetical protein